MHSSILIIFAVLLLITLILQTTTATIPVDRAIPPDSDKKRIIILAQGRSGSSFISSWFNVHPDIFYFLEPCGGAYQKDSTRGDIVGPKCAREVKQLLSCNTEQVDIVKDQTKIIPPRALGFTGWGHKKDIKLCNSSIVIAVKELRIGWTWIKQWDVPFDLRHFSMNDKFILLVRDPRAIYASRIEGWPKPSPSYTDQDDAISPKNWDGTSGMPYDQSLRSLCMEQHQFRIRARDPALVASKKVLLISYEEVLRDPLRVAKNMFEFVDVSLHPQVVKYIEDNMKGECDFKNKPFSLCREVSTTRDDKWKQTLSKAALSELLAIPECRTLINELDKEAAGGGGGNNNIPDFRKQDL
jgi:hypothetical protein